MSKRFFIISLYLKNQAAAFSATGTSAISAGFSSFTPYSLAFSSPDLSVPFMFSFSCSLLSLFCLRLSWSLAFLASFFFLRSSLCSSVSGFSFLWFRLFGLRPSAYNLLRSVLVG